MSCYDEDGKGGNYTLTNSAAGISCDYCDTNIGCTANDTLYEYNGELYCRECLLKNTLGSMGYCSDCASGFNPEDISDHFVVDRLYLNESGDYVCEECLINGLRRIIKAEDPVE